MTRLLARRSRSEVSALVAALAVLCLLCGCGGGGDGGGGTPEPVVDTATVRGTVVEADNVAMGLGRATVQALQPVVAAGVSPAASRVVAQTTTDSGGNFVLRNIPVGTVNILVETPEEASYGSQSITGLQLNKGDDVQLTITVLPGASATPTGLSITPAEAETDLHGELTFTSSVTGSTGALDVTPSYYVTGGIGVVNRSGVFTATQAGTGTLVAVCGAARASSTIRVTAPRAPVITFFSLTPQQLEAAGGKVSITLAARDGDGIAQVVARVYKPDSTIETIIMELDTRTAGTYWLPEVQDSEGETGHWLILPGNTNAYDAEGVQEAQRYSIQVIVTDGSGATTATDFYTVTVAGLDKPPGPFD